MTDQDTQNVCMKAIIDREYDTEPFDIVIAFEFCYFIVYYDRRRQKKKEKKKTNVYLYICFISNFRLWKNVVDKSCLCNYIFCRFFVVVVPVVLAYTQFNFCRYKEHTKLQRAFITNTLRVSAAKTQDRLTQSN